MTPQFLSGVENWAKGAAPFQGGMLGVGPFWQQAPPGQAFPYCRWMNVGPGIPEYFTNPNQLVENIRLQFSFWGTDNNALFGYANQLAARFKAATIPLSSGVVLACLPSGTPYGVGVDPKYKSPDGQPVYHVALDLRFKVD